MKINCTCTCRCREGLKWAPGKLADIDKQLKDMRNFFEKLGSYGNLGVTYNEKSDLYGTKRRIEIVGEALEEILDKSYYLE